MPDELIDIVDENNNLINSQKLKSYVHKVGLPHRTAHIWIYNSKGEVLLQLRSKDKKLYPDLWDISVAGHISAGEEPIEAAIRETKEEISLDISKDDLSFFKVKRRKAIFNDIIDNEFSYAFLLKFDDDINALDLQKEEVEQISFISIEKLKSDLEINSSKYVPHNDYWFEMIDEIKSLTM